MYCVFNMHVLYMCRYPCTCIVKYAFSVCVMYTCMYLHVYIEVHVHISMIMHVCMYCAGKVYSCTSGACIHVFY